MYHRQAEQAQRRRDYLQTEMMAVGERIITLENRLAQVVRDLDRLEAEYKARLSERDAAVHPDRDDI